jgi:ribosomal protein S18 acetylase RimI-like enzyme
MSLDIAPETPSIRKAVPGDIAQLMSLVRRCIQGMRDGGIDQWDEVYPDRQTILADVRAGTAHVAVSEGRLVGMVVLSDQQEPEYAEVAWEHGGRPAVVHRLMVDPPWQSRRVGRLLMQLAEERAAALGYGCIRLDAFCENPRAIRFYERAGYRRVGRVRFRKGLFDCFEKALRRS